jgi:aldehyde:ferredoxin oxidoreductase
MNGRTGRRLRVDLSRATSRTEPIDEETLRMYVGGVGSGVRLLYEELSRATVPLGADSKLVFCTGPLSLNRIPGGGSIELCFKSPLTGVWGESRCGGDFGPDLKRAGFDELIVEGRSEEPVYLVVRNGEAEVRPADHLLGKTTRQKTAIMRRELGDTRTSIMCIGPAGENQVRFANVMFEDRAAGRGGAGAVMGSKRLLGVAAGGSFSVEAADPHRLKAALREASAVLRASPTSTAFRECGTIGDMPANDAGGDWPTKNWQSNSWGRGAELFDVFQSRNLVESYGCYRGCSLACGRRVRVEEGPYQTPLHGGAEYESISCFTAYVLNEDMDAAVHSAYLCNELGLDTISTGAAIAFAMECCQEGLISGGQLGGLDLKWGNGQVLPVLVRSIAERRGLGEVLAEGVRAAAERIGGGAGEFAIHVKGLEGPAHDPRSGKALALAYGTANRGMCHIHPVEAMAWDRAKMAWGLTKYGLPDPESVDRWGEAGKGRAVKLLQDGLVVPDIVGVCKFFMYAGLTLDHYAEMLSALVGREYTTRELLVAGERALNLQRLFNVREGLTREDDRLPDRVKKLPLFGKYQETRECEVANYEAMLDEYYHARGWDPKTGAPTRRTLMRLGLGAV